MHQDHAICSVDSHWEHPHCHLHSHRPPWGHHGTTIHHTTTQCSPSPRAPSLIHPTREATEPQPCAKSSLESAAQRSGSPHQLSAGSRAHPSCPNLRLMACTSHSLTTTAPQATLKPALALPAPRGRQNHPGDNLLGEEMGAAAKELPQPLLCTLELTNSSSFPAVVRGSSTFPLK